MRLHHVDQEDRFFKLLDDACIAARVKQLLGRTQAICMQYLAQLKQQQG